MRLEQIKEHFLLIKNHKILVFKLCSQAGIPYRGIMHDWSKYSPTEFLESIKYYTGKRSPIETYELLPPTLVAKRWEFLLL